MRPATWGQSPKGWTCLHADINWEDHGGLWCKRDRHASSKRTYWVLRFESTDHWGDDGGPRPKYEASTGWVTLDDVPEDTIKSALASCGWERDPDGGIWCPHSGDLVAPIEKTDLVILDALAGWGAIDWDHEYDDKQPLRLRARVARSCT
jgi:hypothetical protein